MIVHLSKPEWGAAKMEALDRRAWRYSGEERSGSKADRRTPTMVEFRKILYSLPFLFLSGVFTGIALMLAMT